MRLVYCVTLAASAAIAFGEVAGAQETVLFKAPAVPSRFTLGGDAVMLQPKGEFANNIARGRGFNGTGLMRIDNAGYLQLRIDGGVAQYGSETKRIPLNPITGRVSFEVVTSNRVAWVYGTGVNIPFGRKFPSGMLNFGARYYQGAEAAYLRKGDITDNADGTISFTPRRSRIDMILWQLGAAFTLPR